VKNFTSAVRNAAEKGKNTVKDVKTYWNHPREGEYVSNKEFMYFILGSGGCQSAGHAEGYLYFSAGCFFVGAIYGLAMQDFVRLGFVYMILDYFFAPIDMLVMDNLGKVPRKTMRAVNRVAAVYAVFGIACMFIPQHYFEFIMPALPQVIGSKFILSVVNIYFKRVVLRKFAPKYGKYKPWIFVNWPFFVITSVLLVYFPYNNFSYYNKFWIMGFLFQLWWLFSNYNDQHGAIENVISPNTLERTRIMAIGSLIYNLFPSIVGIVLPVAVAATGGFTVLRSYQTSILFTMLMFSPMVLFLAFKVQDRVIIDFDREPNIDFKRGIRAVFHNKYLWIRTASDVLGGFSQGLININTIMVIYMLRKDWMFGILHAILGTTNIPAYLTARYFIQRYGKKKVWLTARYLSLITSAFSVVAVLLNSFVLLIVVNYISGVINQYQNIAHRGMTPDIWDYQQYISNERFEGFMNSIRMLTAPLGPFMALLVPTVYAGMGFTSDWTVLYDPMIRNKIFIFTIVLSVVVSLITVIPMHFYDLTEDKHRDIIKELQRREEERLAALTGAETETENADA
jgi:glycoside/pentoside/hexuronide:cation symporter, GPH family